MKVRITKIICPHCAGEKTIRYSEDLAMPCGLCLGAGRIAAAVARQYADNLYTIAVGGYALGDHDQKEKDRLTKTAMDVFRLLGEMPPWLRTAA